MSPLVAGFHWLLVSAVCMQSASFSHTACLYCGDDLARWQALWLAQSYTNVTLKGTIFTMSNIVIAVYHMEIHFKI